MRAAQRFPQPVRKVEVVGGKASKIYEFLVPEGYVGFLYRFGTPMVEGGYGCLSVDGEAVTDPTVVGETVDGKIVKLHDSLINPPVVVEKGVEYEFYSPVDAEVTFVVDGELWRRTERRVGVTTPIAEPVPVYVVPKAVEPVVAERKVEAEAMPVKVYKAERVRVTDTHERENFTVSEYTQVWEKRGTGEINELWVKATSTAFELAVFVDGKYPYYGDYAYYAARSGESEDISAEQRDSEYVIHLERIKFVEYAALMVIPTSPVHFNHVYIKYEVEA